MTFPIHNEDGKVLFIAERSIRDKRYYFPAGMTKPCYGLYQLKTIESKKPLVITEGIFDCLTMVRYGYKAIALMGLGNKLQYEQISRLPNRKIIIALDPDAAGNRAINRFKEFVRNKHLYIFEYPDDRDLNELGELVKDLPIKGL